MIMPLYLHAYRGNKNMPSFDIFLNASESDFHETVFVGKHNKTVIDVAPLVMFKDDRFMLVREHDNYVNYALYYADGYKHSVERIGDAEIKENYLGDDKWEFSHYQVNINQYPDEDTGSDVRVLGEVKDHNEALKLLWENRHYAFAESA